MKYIILKSTILFLFTFASFSTLYAQWNMIGTPIIGEEDGDQIGRYISMSQNGQRIAIGAPSNSGNGTAAGHVRIFELSGSDWVQVGADIEGEVHHDFAGIGVRLNADGTRVVIGSPGNDEAVENGGQARVFEWTGLEWIQLGGGMNGINYSDNFGTAVDINALGDIVVVGSSDNDDGGTLSGHVRVFRLIDGDWEQMGDAIAGAAAYDYFGGAVSIDADGFRVAIGATGNDDNGSFAGHVRIFDFEDGTWEQVGASIEGERYNDKSGGSVDISGDGQTVIIGSSEASHGGSAYGQAQIFKYTGADWVQLGADIEGDYFGAKFGISVCINDAGTIVAIGQPYKYLFGMQDVGQAQVYQFDGTDWLLRSTVITGTSTNNAAGMGVSLGSSDPLMVAVGIPGGTLDGRVEIYELATAAIDQTITENISFTVFPNPSNGLFTLKTTELTEGFIRVYSLDGKCIYLQTLKNKTTQLIDLSMHEKGIYYLQLLNGEESFTQKISLQ